MKKSIYLLALLLLSMASVSCKDFLGEENVTNYDVTRLVNSKEALQSNILGCQRQFASSGFKSGSFCEWLAPGSGLFIWGGTSNLSNALERWTSLHKFTRFSKHPESYDSFRSFYRAIYRCNSLISSLPLSQVDQKYKDQIEGEARFIRAISYFYLVRLYGNVTIHTDVAESLDQLYGPREDFWKVYNMIVKELTTASKMLPDYNTMVANAGGNSSGRVCDYAAIAFRSLVYLTIGSLLESPDDNFWVSPRQTPDFSEIGITSPEQAFELAKADALNVIENGPFELCPDYRQLFRWTEPEDWQLKERIWALPRSPEAGDAGSGLTQWALPCYYNNTDKVANFGRCRPDRWFFQKWCEAYGGVAGTGSNNSNIYVSCGDPRLDINMVHTSYRGQVTTSNPSGILACYPANNRIYPTTNILMKYYGIPYYKKYYDPTFNNTTGNSDFYVMRLAEVYLIAAEAYAWLGDSNNSVKYVNVILKRARESVDSGTSSEPQDWVAGDFKSKEELVTAIFWERCFEMPFEHHEYFDTHRFGAKWLTENIAKPKNIFLYLPEQCDYLVNGEHVEGYRSLYYGKDFLYDEDWTLVRKGLINGYPNDELVYNPSLDVNKSDPNLGQNLDEVFWR